MVETYWRRWNFIFFVSHSERFGRRRSLTIMFCASSVGGAKGPDWWSVESQFWRHIGIHSPFPKNHTIPLLIMSLPANIPRHPWDAAFGAEHVRMSWCWQYLFNKVCPNRELGFLNSFQVCLESSASLKTSNSQNPRPPAPLGKVSLSHDIQYIFLNSGFMSHQNLVKTLWICLQRDLGSLKQDIAYVGIDPNTAFKSTIFPAPDRYLTVHPFTRCLMRSTIEAKMSLFFLPKCSGKPRYLPIPPSFKMLRSSFTRILHSWLVLEEKVIADFYWFIHWPDAASYGVKQLATFDFPKNIVTSANNKWFIGGQCRPTFTPGRVPLNIAWLHRPDGAKDKEVRG